MNQPLQSEPPGRRGTWKPAARGRWVALLALGFVLLVVGALVVTGTYYLRGHLRQHLVERDGEVLYTVALARQYANGTGAELTRRLGDPVAQLGLALDISQLREGVMGVRLFDEYGQFVTAVPATLVETNLPTDTMRTLQKLRPVSRFFERARLEDYFWLAPEESQDGFSAVLEANIPLHSRGQTNLVGAAQLLLDGSELASAFAQVDTHLNRLAGGVFGASALVLSGILFWAYRRLEKANRLLLDRTTRLLRSNHELALAAKTSAVGSVTAHLIHGLSNPLAHLQDFIAAQGRNGGMGRDLEEVAAATRRMQQLVHEVVRVLGEERGGDHYGIALTDLVSVLNEKMRAAVEKSGARLGTELKVEAEMANRHANLVLLILENLTDNALRVTPSGSWVRVSIERSAKGVRCKVSDQGPGIPDDVVPRLFTPCRSTHGGSGLGLAISKQLANHLGATLELESTGPIGTTFGLDLPPALFDCQPVPGGGRKEAAS